MCYSSKLIVLSIALYLFLHNIRSDLYLNTSFTCTSTPILQTRRVNVPFTTYYFIQFQIIFFAYSVISLANNVTPGIWIRKVISKNWILILSFLSSSTQTSWAGQCLFYDLLILILRMMFLFKIIFNISHEVRSRFFNTDLIFQVFDTLNNKDF
jgi:hypothetical protein